MVAKLRLHRREIAELLCFLALYLICFSLIEKFVTPEYIIHCKLDDMIPFCKWAIIPYVFWFLWIPLCVLLVLFVQPEQFPRLYWSMVLGCACALIVYILLPNGLHLRHTVVGDDLLSRAVRLIYKSDTSTNVCPSLHVFQSVIICIALFRCDRLKKLRIPALFITVLICCSTVLLDQHSVIDVIAALALTLCVDSALEFHYRRKTQLSLQHVHAA